MSFREPGIARVRSGVILDVEFRRGGRQDLRASWCTAGSRKDYGPNVTFGVGEQSGIHKNTIYDVVELYI